MSASKGMEFAKAQLLKYGWKEGKGLGRHESGIAEALKPKLKFDTTGIGHDGSEQFTYNWWEHAFNKAAQNVKVHATENGVTVNADEDLEISTKKYSVLTVKKKKNLEYGTFLKTSTLTNEGRIVHVVKEEEEEAETTTPIVNTTSFTDEDLFNICGGRTAHKGARHGLKLNGKLARIEAQEQQLLFINLKSGKNNFSASETYDSTGSFVGKTKMKKKKKKKAELEQYSDSALVNNGRKSNFSENESYDCTGSLVGKTKMKKKKKKKEREHYSELQTDSTLVNNDSVSYQVIKKKKKRKMVKDDGKVADLEENIPSKKKKRRNLDGETQGNICNEEGCVVSELTCNNKVKKHKKHKLKIESNLS